MPLNEIWAYPQLGGDLSESPRRVTAEHTRELYRLAHLSRYRAYDRVHVLIDVLSQDASPADEPNEEEHDRNNQ